MFFMARLPKQIGNKNTRKTKYIKDKTTIFHIVLRARKKHRIGITAALFVLVKVKFYLDTIKVIIQIKPNNVSCILSKS